MVSWAVGKALPPCYPVSHLAGLCFALANSCIWLLVGFGLFLPCLGTAWHSLLSYILSACWLCDVVLLKSWPFAWLSGIASWPANCLKVTTYCPVHLLASMYGLLIVLSIDCTWALASCCPVSCSKCLALPSCWVHLLTLWDCSSAAWHTCGMFGTALATCWMFGVFLMPFHLILEYSVPLLFLESAYSLIFALLPSCPLAFMPGISIILSYPSA